MALTTAAGLYLLLLVPCHALVLRNGSHLPPIPAGYYAVFKGPGNERCSDSDKTIFKGNVEKEEECERRCNETAGCLFFQVNHPRRVRESTQELRWCRLTSSCNKLVNETKPGIVVIKKTVDYTSYMGPSAERCTGDEGLVYSGPTKSKEECRDRCSTDVHCMFYHHQPGTNKNWCRLSETCEQTTTDPSRSGIETFKKVVDEAEWAKRMEVFNQRQARQRATAALLVDKERVKQAEAKAAAKRAAEENIVDEAAKKAAEKAARFERAKAEKTAAKDARVAEQRAEAKARNEAQMQEVAKETAARRMAHEEEIKQEDAVKQEAKEAKRMDSERRHAERALQAQDRAAAAQAAHEASVLQKRAKKDAQEHTKKTQEDLAKQKAMNEQIQAKAAQGWTPKQSKQNWEANKKLKGKASKTVG